MEIDYFERSTDYSVLDLLHELRDIIDSNPQIDFSRVGVSINDEYMAEKAKLDSWIVDKKIRVMVDIGL